MENDDVEFRQYINYLGAFTELVHMIPVIEEISTEARDEYIRRLKMKKWFEYFYTTPIRDYSFDQYSKYVK